MIQSMLNKRPYHNENHSDHAASAARAAMSWIEDVLQVNFPDNSELRSTLASGEILCSLMNTIIPGAIKRINRCPNRASASDNLSLFLTACEIHCGIPKSRLFDIDDFEDIFDRGNDCNSQEGKTDKHSERVAISIFWLAKFIDEDPRWPHFPKLDYSAFADLLPWRLTKTTRSCLLTSPSLSRPTYAGTRQFTSSTHTASHFTSEEHTSQLLSSYLVAMGSKQSSLSGQGIEPGFQPHSLPSSLNIPVEQQKNNNGTEEDDWQANLDAWRERRRLISRMQATTLTSFEQLRLEEEKKKQDAARDRLRQIITQHSIISNPYIPSTNISQPVTPSSPGLAILTGRAHGSFDFRFTTDDSSHPVVSSVASSAELSGPDPSPVIEENKQQGTSPQSSDSGTFPNGGSHCLPAVVESSPSLKQEYNQKPLVMPGSDTEAGSLSLGDYQQIQLRVQPKPKSAEVRWGMTLKARGPSNTAPFVVEHVKIGSTADVCDLSRGDILIRVNGTDLGHTSESMTLRQLESFLDGLCYSGHTVSVHVLRKCNRLDDSVDEDSNCSPVDASEPIPSKISPVRSEQSSDIDEQNYSDIAVLINRSPFRAVNSMHVVKRISHELNEGSIGVQNSDSQKQLESNSQKTSRVYEVETFVTPDASSEAAHLDSPSIAQPTFDLPVRSSLTTRI